MPESNSVQGLQAIQELPHAIRRLGELSADKGSWSRTPRQNVRAHTPVLISASERFRKALTGVHLPAQLPANVRLLSGIDGDTVFDVRTGADKLARQIQQTVDWAACMESCQAAGVTKVVELGPGRALARLMREVMPEGDVHSLSEFHSLTGFERWLQSPPD